MACSETGLQKCIEIDDDKKLLPFFDKRMAQEVYGDSLGDEFVGYRFRITGGNDKQGFPMKQGILTNQRVRLLLKKGSSCYRMRKRGERKRKSVRGCIVGSDLAVLNLVVEKKGPAEIEGLTDTQVAKRLGPKRANNIRKVFTLEKADDVRGYVDLFRRKFVGNNGKDVNKGPKIQRLITPLVRARRLTKLKARQAVARDSQAKRKEYLVALGHSRMQQRQRQASRAGLKQAAQDKISAGQMKKTKKK